MLNAGIKICYFLAVVSSVPWHGRIVWMLQPPCTIKMNFPTGYPGLTLRYLYAIEQNSFLDNNYTFNSWLIGNFASDLRLQISQFKAREIEFFSFFQYFSVHFLVLNKILPRSPKQFQFSRLIYRVVFYSPGNIW